MLLTIGGAGVSLRRLPSKCGFGLLRATKSVEGTNGVADDEPPAKSPRPDDKSDFKVYQEQQRGLAQGQAPEADLDFHSLVKQRGRYAFVDNSAYILETCNIDFTAGKKLLIRPRRFGKTTFGLLWLEFFRGNKELFHGMEVPNEKVPEPGTYVCVHLSLSGTSPTTFAVHKLMPVLNKALAAAELPRIHPQPPDVFTLLSSFVAAVDEAGKEAAIFIDEYDYMVLKSRGEAYQQAVDTMETLFVCLKDHDAVIPFLFITGSSRIAISGIWSGGNNIDDVSYKASFASVLGYNWEQIEKLYSVQLSMLERLHGMTREQLKDKMETMYNGYRFSPDSSEKVFSVWAINRFMESGKFEPHFSLSGVSSALVTGSFPPTTIAAMAVPGYEYESDIDALKTWRYSPDHASEEFSAVVQLLGAGVLTFSPRHCNCFMVPNEDARFALLHVLPKFASGFDAASFSSFVESGDICGMVTLLQPVLKNVASQASQNAAGAESILEYHIQHAFFALTYSVKRQRKDVNWTVTSEVRTQRDGTSPRADFLISLQDGSHHSLEFGVLQGSVLRAVKNKLEQATQKYFDVARDLPKTKVTVIIWSKQGDLACVAGPYDKATAATKIGILESAAEDDLQSIEGVWAAA